MSRHEEYKESFQDFFDKAKSLKPDLIFVGGDIVHSKTQGISPELIDILSWWFRGLNDIAPTHIILGNHDGLISNKHRQDAISPIINALELDQTTLYKDSGTYPTGIPGINWGVFSCFDEERWGEVKPIPDEINIALFHGGVLGSTTDINWDIEGEVEASFFKDFDFAFLGDIHRMQYLDKEKRIAYPGSTIQQNYGEDPGKGFLFWEIESKDKFTSKFYEIAHNQPFVTIEWTGTVYDTVNSALKYPKNARFRIKSDFAIPQAEIKQLHSELQEKLDASEIVFKYETFDNSQVATFSDGNDLLNMRDPAVLLNLLKEFYAEKEVEEEEWTEIEQILKKQVALVSKTDPPRNIKWSLKQMNFSNTFAYGKNNKINFSNLSGIIGLFGRNRSGKSSIPGTLMYSLFNSTDRGSIKNLHVINTRKGHCVSEIDFEVNGITYRVERQSVKKQNRKGEVSAATQANFWQLDSSGNPTVDMSGEQRRDTDKTLRDLIGTKENFLLTSFASQGDMNAFIKNRATQRKQILSHFLDLDIFEKVLEVVKEESSYTKALLAKYPEREWKSLILEKALKLRSLQIERDSSESDYATLQQRLQSLRIHAANQNGQDIVTPTDVKNQETQIQISKNRLQDINELESEIKEKIEAINQKLEKIGKIKNQFPIEDLRNSLDSKNSLEKKLIKISADLRDENRIFESQNNSIKLLQQVPCGDQFPTCKFIKNSHESKKLVEAQKEKISSISDGLDAVQSQVNSLMSQNLENKIKKYQRLLESEGELKIDISDLRVSQGESEREKINLTDSLIHMKDELSSLKSRVVDSQEVSELDRVKSQISKLEVDLKAVDAKRLSLSENIGLLNSELKRLEEEKEEYTKLLGEWRIFELIMRAFDKRGIPIQILSSQLPKINAEISRILQGVVGFTVELEADSNSNSMDIYLNYGDSRRIIECGSGMEKMISSLAIRVALINVSSLPKSDILIIDEGFGTLDEMNIEACNRLLTSLKRWFKSIFVISHIDAVKDATDNIVEITSKGKDSRVVVE
jgi:DNA repair exonuclease SbcCD ATPase subunit/DNA repair exonuclease SbcCD nuclease subunit